MYSIPLAAAVPLGRVLAVDEQPRLLDRLRAKLEARPSCDNVQPVLTEDGRAPLDDGVADRMLIVNVLHHVDDDPGALVEIYRLLAPGGLLVAAEFAQMDRPVGPANDHVLPLDDGARPAHRRRPDGTGRLRAGLRRAVPQRHRRPEAASVSARSGAGTPAKAGAGPDAAGGAPRRSFARLPRQGDARADARRVARAPRRALRRLVRHRPPRASASPSRSTCSAPLLPRRPSPRTRRRWAACCARSSGPARSRSSPTAPAAPTARPRWRAPTSSAASPTCAPPRASRSSTSRTTGRCSTRRRAGSTARSPSARRSSTPTPSSRSASSRPTSSCASPAASS